MRVIRSLVRLHQSNRIFIPSEELIFIPSGELVFNIAELLGTTESLTDPDLKLLGEGKSDFTKTITIPVKLFSPFTIAETTSFVYGGIQAKMTMNSIAIVRAGPSLYNYFNPDNSSDLEEFYMISLSMGMLTRDQINDMVLTYLNKIMNITDQCLNYETTSEYIDVIIPTGVVFRFHLKIFDSITSLLMTFQLPYHQIATNTDNRVIGTQAAITAINTKSISGLFTSDSIQQAIEDRFNVSNAMIGSWKLLYEEVVEYVNEYNGDRHLSGIINQLTQPNVNRLIEVMTAEIDKLIEEDRITPIPYYYLLVQKHWIETEIHIGVIDVVNWLKTFIGVVNGYRQQLLNSNIFQADNYVINYYDHNYVYNWRIQQGIQS